MNAKPAPTAGQPSSAMRTRYSLETKARQESYDLMLKAPQQDFAGFSLYAPALAPGSFASGSLTGSRGLSFDSCHFLFGLDHTPGSYLAIQTALHKLVRPGDLVLSEGVLGGRDCLIDDTYARDDLDARRGDLGNWEKDIVDMVIARHATLVQSDSTGMKRRQKRLAQSHVAPRIADASLASFKFSEKREMRMARKILDYASQYLRVISVDGSLHALSPIVHDLLRELPMRTYIYTGIYRQGKD